MREILAHANPSARADRQAPLPMFRPPGSPGFPDDHTDHLLIDRHAAFGRGNGYGDPDQDPVTIRQITRAAKRLNAVNQHAQVRQRPPS